MHCKPSRYVRNTTQWGEMFLVLIALLGSALPLEAFAQVSNDLDRQSIQLGKELFNGKAFCFGCHGKDGDITDVSNPMVAGLNPQPTDLRKPTDKSVRQLFLIIKYGIPATGMIPIEEAAKLSDQAILNVISYLLNLQGKPRSVETISDQHYHRHTPTDKAIASLCEEEAIGDSDMEAHCQDRYAKRYRDLIIGRPPDISAKRYAEIETGCSKQWAKDLDKLALCYRKEYVASR